jgi:hypothetical protein
MVLFCQMDVSGRTEPDPAASRLARNLVQYAATWQATPTRRAVYAGGTPGREHLAHAGIATDAYQGGQLTTDQVLVVAKGGAEALSAHRPAIAGFVNAGGRLLAVGLSQSEADACLPRAVTLTDGEHIACTFEPFGRASLLAGIGPADLHNRAPRTVPLVTGGARPIGDGVLGNLAGTNVVLYQFPPYDLTKAKGAVAGFTVEAAEALDGRSSALVTMGTPMGTGGQFGQTLKAGGEAGKTYTFAVSLQAIGEPVALHLEIERAGSPWDRALKTEDVQVATGDWTELHATFTPEQSFAEGWQAYVACAQDGGRFRVDMMRLYEGDYVPWDGAGAGAGNLLANPSFEAGTEPWWFNCGEQYNLRRTYRRASFTLTRLLANMGVRGDTPLLSRFGAPVTAGEKRWLEGMYLDQPETWDDPYRFFCW